MKKIFLFLISFFIFITNTLASLGIITPKEYNITINNINLKEIEKIELLYKTHYQILYYEKNNPYREWIYKTDFGYKYKNYDDSEIIPTLSTEQLDEISNCYNSDSANSTKGYWLENDFKNNNENKINNSITKYAIYDDVKIKYNINNISINLPAPTSERIFIRLEKKDNTVIYSNIISSKLIEYYDEHTPNIEIEKKENVKNKIAQFEVDYKNISNNFEVIEVEPTNIINKKINKTINIAIYIIITSIILIIIYKLNKRTRKFAIK